MEGHNGKAQTPQVSSLPSERSRLRLTSSPSTRTDKQLHAQTALPLTLIPIRIDLNIPSFTPAAPLPLPSDALSYGINPTLPVYRTPEATTAYKLSDVFLWNLHETLVTPDMFALGLVHDLDLPNPTGTAMEIAVQIRRQLEEHATIALHPLFQTSPSNSHDLQTNGTIPKPLPTNHASTPLPLTNGTSSTPQPNGHPSTPQPLLTEPITAVASRAPPPSGPSPVLNPDDTYRCIISLSIYLQNRLLTDKFEWSLLHPPGFAELFSKQTVADLGLPAEWVPVMAHAIYEAVLKLKKEACESGGVLVGAVDGGNGLDNGAALGADGWRYDEEGLCAEWAPGVERLSKEEIEKREGDRERQIRRMRRETARFTSSAVLQPQYLQPSTPGYFDQPAEGEAMGRGERSKKKRRFRSLSPVGRVGTPGGRGTPDAGGYGGAGATSQLNEAERQIWRCSHCMVHGSAVWGVKDGPIGPRVSVFD